MQIERLLDAPIITAASHPSIGENIQGPSLVRVPTWLPNPLGRYYLYFADHKGAYIRLAYADALTGPWTIHAPGSLHLAESGFPTQAPPATPEQIDLVRRGAEKLGVQLQHGFEMELTYPHIASPDVHVDDTNERIVMYFHGLESFARQSTRVAVSRDGVHFEARPEILGRSYFRVFDHAGTRYALAMPGLFYRSKNGFDAFESGPTLFDPDMRHCALLLRGDTLHVFWTRVGETPESILHSTIDVGRPFESWTESEPSVVLRPEHDWEGADAPLVPSVRSVAYGHVNQLRDPAIYEEEDRVYLLYSVAGESGIAISQLFLD